MKDLTVYILTHNRGKLLIDTLNSVINQSCNDYEIIVSDNSSNNDTYDLIREYHNVKYIKREKEYSSTEHFNLCIEEVKTKYFILFHDDDIMCPNMIEELYNSISENDYIAVGCNAYLLVNDKKTKKTMLRNKRNKVLHEPSDMVMQYMDNYSIVPYPSYIYNKEKIGDLRIKTDYGKYSDVTWLLNINSKGEVLWLHNVYMYYRIHSGQDSSGFNYYSQQKLLRKYCKYVSKGNLVVLKYRYLLVYLNAIRKYQLNRDFSLELKILFNIRSLKYFTKLLLINMKKSW